MGEKSAGFWGGGLLILQFVAGHTGSPLFAAPVFYAPLPGGHLIYILKSPGKVQLVGIPHHISDVRNGQLRQFQKLRGLGHPVGDQEFLGRLSHIFMKYFSEITPVQPAGGGDILYGDIVLEILLDEGDGFFNIEIPQAVSLSDLGGGGRAHQGVHEQIEMADEVKGGFLPVIDDIQHFFLHFFANIFIAGFVDGIFLA